MALDESPRPSSSNATPPLRHPSTAKTKRSSKRTQTKPSVEEESKSSLRTRTYYRRKEEKEMLERKVQGLMLQLQHLARRGVVEIRRDSLTIRTKRNQELRDSIQGQRIIFANTQSFISEFLRAYDHSKYEPIIRLGSDPRGRYETLLAMKQQRLQEAVYFLSERSRQMRLDTEYTDLQRFTSSNGDICMVGFDIMPLPTAQDVMQAFEGVLKFAYNLEISISDLVGDLTIRENDHEDWESSIAQHRLVTKVDHGVQVDTNVTFTQYWEDGTGPMPNRAVGKELGISVCDYVDEDTLYPYDESERVRQDITFFVVIAKYPRDLPGAFNTIDITSAAFVGSPSSTASESGASVCESIEGQDDMVVALRWTCLRLRKPPFPLDNATATHIRDSMEKVGPAMFTAISHSVDGESTPRTAPAAP